MMKNLELSLQLFAEGDTAQFTGETPQAVAAPAETGETAAPDAGVQDDSAEFDRLIRGKYKDAYNEKLRSVVQKRLRGHKELTERMDALAPVLEQLQKRCGVEAGDIPALARAVENLPQPPDPEDSARQQQTLWAAQAVQTQKAYPAFDLGKELEDPMFCRLLRCDVPVQVAYEVLHHREILPAALAHTAFTVEQKLAKNLAAMGNRPAESALGNHSAAVVRNDVSQMTRGEREAIIHRVRKGETIRF